MAWLPAIATVAASIFASEGQEDTNDTNREIQQNNSAFNAEEAERARQFNAEQGNISRDFNAEQAALNRTFNADEARINRSFTSDEAALNRNDQTDQAIRQMQFQERMANTSWERAIADMNRAGLNPMLAYRQGGAQAPSGAMGHGSAAQGSAASGSAASSGGVTGPAASAGSPGNALNPYAAAGATASQWAQIENVQADTSKKKAEEDLVRAQIPKTHQDEEVSRSNAALLKNLAVKALYDTDLSAAQKKKVEAEVDQVLARTKNLDADTRLKKVNEVLQRHDVPRMEAESTYFKTPIGRESPHNKYGPQSPFRLIEGLGERMINRNAARLYPPDGGPRKPW